MQESTPDVASVPEKLTVRGRSYQPFASGPRAGVTVVAGPVESYLSGSEAVAALPALSRQEPLTEAPPLSGPE